MRALRHTTVSSGDMTATIKLKLVSAVALLRNRVDKIASCGDST